MKPKDLGVTVRRLEGTEVDVLQQSMPASRRLVDGVPRTYHERRLAAQQDGAADYLIAWGDGSPVGHALLRWSADEPFLRDRELTAPLVEALAVRPDVQSRGIATAMMLEAERMAADRGQATIGLAVGIENERARALYARLGYYESGLGEFRVTWTALDADGEERVKGETCTYLVKRLRYG
jgi:ribosomal protein S18 acetylase RimI-like enzyme